jgi:hypothetical protein
MSETPPEPAYPVHMEKASAGLFEHCIKVVGLWERLDLKNATGRNGIAGRTKPRQNKGQMPRISELTTA